MLIRTFFLLALSLTLSLSVSACSHFSKKHHGHHSCGKRGHHGQKSQEHKAIHEAVVSGNYDQWRTLVEKKKCPKAKMFAEKINKDNFADLTKIAKMKDEIKALKEKLGLPSHHGGGRHGKCAGHGGGHHGKCGKCAGKQGKCSAQGGGHHGKCSKCAGKQGKCSAHSGGHHGKCSKCTGKSGEKGAQCPHKKAAAPELK